MKKAFFLYFLVLIPILGVMACVFDSDDVGVSSYLADQNLPTNYKVQVLSIDGLIPTSAKGYLNAAPYAANDRAVLGTSFDLYHDLYFDFAFRDEDFFSGFAKDDEANGSLELHLLSSFYNFPSLNYTDSLPLKEELTLSFSWVLATGKGNAFIDSIGDVYNSEWHAQLKTWKAETFDTTYSLEIDSFDSLLILPLPSALVEAMQTVSDACRLQLKVSAKGSSRLYRLNGSYSGLPPLLRLRGSENTFTGAASFRMAAVSDYIEETDNRLVLHSGGIAESLIVELPKEKIMTALSEFYGDEFPYNEGDGNDVRQTVIIAQITMPISKAQGQSTLDKPVLMEVRSFVDSLGKEAQVNEFYKINKALVLEKGHPNFILGDSDSLTLQITYGMRDFINKAKSNDNFRFCIHLGYPTLELYDPNYRNHINIDGDSIFFYLPHFDYARYDLAPSLEKPMTMKLWLATKRGEEE